MGFQEYPVIFFGCIISYEEFLKIVTKFKPELDIGEEDEEDMEEEIRDFYEQELREIIEKKYNSVALSCASPYYDAEFKDRTFYVHLKAISTNSFTFDKYDLQTAQGLISTYFESDYKKFFEYVSLEYREPEFTAICNIH